MSVLPQEIHFIFKFRFYAAKKKNEILPFAATWMDLEGIMISEMNLTEKDKFCMISLIDGILKIQQVSEYSKKEADPQLWRAS